MSNPEGPAAAESGSEPHIPTFEELAADPEIAPLLDFEPVPRSHAKANCWTADMQRMFIAWLAYYGSPTNACDELQKARSGIDKVYKSPDAEEFRASWDAAVELAEKRRIERLATRRGGAGAMRAPTISRSNPLPGQLLHERDEWEDEDSLDRRGEEALLSIRNKLLMARRLYLQEISASAGKRAAFEILVELPIDWELAAQLKPQADEPWRIVNMRQPDMLLTAESGWMGDWLPGPDKIAELRRAIDDYRAAEGMEPVNWGESTESRE